MPQILKQPVYRLHNSRPCVVVTLNGKNYNHNPWQSRQSCEKFSPGRRMVVGPGLPAATDACRSSWFVGFGPAMADSE